MSGLLDQAGLTAGSGLSNGAGLYKWGNFNPFDPTDLDPYLLFDTAAGSMIGTLENPTLDLDPSNQETLDVITATRAGIATYTDPDGNIATASADTVRVDYTQGAELTPTKFQRFGNTEFDQAYWSFSSQMGSPVYNYDTAPNGEQEATRIVSNGGSYPQIVETIEGFTIGQQYTASFYVKSDGTSQIQQFTHFTGLSGRPFTPTDTWERVTYTITATATSHSFVIFTNGSSTPASSYLIWGPQLEEGTTATTFVENTTGSPKFTGISATYSPRVPMILVEPSSENLITRSEDFSFSGWTKNGASVANGISSPDGNNTAFKLTEDATGSGHYLQETVTVSSATIYTASIFVKYESREWIRFTDAESINRVHFNTRTGQFGTVVGTVIDYSSTELDDGWHRITITSTSAGTAYSMRIILAESDNDVAYTGDDTSGIYVWGAQLETGSVATSYIPTSGGDAAARTRAADDLEITGSAFSSFFNNSEGTIYCEFNGAEVDYNYIYNVRQDAANEIRSQRIPSGRIRTRYTVASAHIASPSPSGASQGSLNRHAFSYKTNNFRGNSNGGSDDEQLSGNASLAPVSIQIGGRGNGIANIKFKRLIYWPYHSDSL